MPDDKKNLAVPVKPSKTVVHERLHLGSLIVKFQEGSGIKAQRKSVRAGPKSIKGSIKDQAKTIEKLLDRFPDAFIYPLFPRSEDQLLKEKFEAEKLSGVSHADPTLYFTIHFKNGDVASRAAELAIIADELNKLDIVEIAYPQRMPYPAAAADIAPVTLNLTNFQGYLDAAPLGIDARYAWTFPGGRGDGCRVIDIENAWRLDHEDLPPPFFNGTGIGFVVLQGNQDWIEHGTAVLGEMVAAENPYGVTGISPRASYGVCTTIRLGGVAAAIDEASSLLSPGDVILIEVHYPGPRSDFWLDVVQNRQLGFIPVEFDPADFAAIHRATSRGIVVIEPAGNGGENLDDPIFHTDPPRGDSGAIMVGAGVRGTNVPHGFSNHGSRVNVQGWGDSVTTIGGGTIRVDGGDRRQWYRTEFSGTSSASPIVASAVLCLQGILRAHGMPLLPPGEVRRRLIETGTQQPTDEQIPGVLANHIGPLPNLRAAIDSLGIAPPTPSFWPSMGGLLKSAPCVGTNHDGRLEVFAIGASDHIWRFWQTAPRNGWSTWTELGNEYPHEARFTGRPVVVRNLDGRMEVFVRAINGKVWHIWQTSPNNDWSNWESLGGEVTSDPAVGINDNGRLEVFARWSDGSVRHIYQRFTNWGWSGWEPLHGQIIGSPAVGRNGDTRLQVVARAPNGEVFHIWQESPGGGWSSWTPLDNGFFSADPVIASDYYGRMFLFGRGTHGDLWFIAQTSPSGRWGTWIPLGGTLGEGAVPSIGMHVFKGLEVFVRFDDGGVRHRWQSGPDGDWSDWHDLGGNIGSDPAVGRNLDNRLEVFARGSDQSMVHRWQTGAPGPWNEI